MTTPATATRPVGPSTLGELTRVVLAPAAGLTPDVVGDAGQIAALLTGPEGDRGHTGYQVAHATAARLIGAAGHDGQLQQSLDAVARALTGHLPNHDCATLESVASIAAGACLAVHARPLGLPGLDYATLIIPWACLTRRDS